MDSNLTEQKQAEFRAKIKSLIGHNKINEAVELLIDWAVNCPQPNPYSNLFLIQTYRYHAIMKKYISGTANNQVILEEKNKIIFNILELIDKMDE